MAGLQNVLVWLDCKMYWSGWIVKCIGLYAFCGAGEAKHHLGITLYVFYQSVCPFVCHDLILLVTHVFLEYIVKKKLYEANSSSHNKSTKLTHLSVKKTYLSISAAEWCKQAVDSSYLTKAIKRPHRHRKLYETTNRPGGPTAPAQGVNRADAHQGQWEEQKTQR